MNILKRLTLLMSIVYVVHARYAGVKYCNRFRHLVRCINIARVPDIPSGFTRNVTVLDMSGSRIRNLDTLESLQAWPDLQKVIVKRQKVPFDCARKRTFAFNVETDCPNNTDKTSTATTHAAADKNTQTTRGQFFPTGTEVSTIRPTTGVHPTNTLVTYSTTVDVATTSTTTPSLAKASSTIDHVKSTPSYKSVKAELTTRTIPTTTVFVTSTLRARFTRIQPPLRTAKQTIRRRSSTISSSEAYGTDTSSTEADVTTLQTSNVNTQTPSYQARHIMVAVIVLSVIVFALLCLIASLLYRFCLGCRQMLSKFCQCCPRIKSYSRRKDKDSDADSPAEMSLYERPSHRRKHQSKRERSTSRRLPGIIDTLESQAATQAKFEWERWSDCEL